MIIYIIYFFSLSNFNFPPGVSSFMPLFHVYLRRFHTKDIGLICSHYYVLTAIFWSVYALCPLSSKITESKHLSLSSLTCQVVREINSILVKQLKGFF